MTRRTPGVLPRLIPVVLVTAAAMSYAAWVERADAYLGRNLVPMLLLVVLAAVALHRGKGSWTGSGWCWPLATIGFALPALGLSLYLHYGYTVDLNGMVSESIYPQEVFRYLPIYTTFAGAIGFSIGWIAGKNVN
jgi:predicted Na+-dependent transporter